MMTVGATIENASLTDIVPEGCKSVLSLVDEVAVSTQAKSESRNREKHLPPLGIFRWWARRTGAVNEAVLNAATTAMGKERLSVLDPFAGGGTIPLVSLRAGHAVYAQDLNPWAANGIKQMLTLPSPSRLRKASEAVWTEAHPLVKRAYATKLGDGTPGTVLHTYRVAIGECGRCGHNQRQFPYSLLTLRKRKERGEPAAILACPAGHISDGFSDRLNDCPQCDRVIDPKAYYTPRRIIVCAECGHPESLNDRAQRPSWGWEVVLVERYGGGRREFSLPTTAEIAQAEIGWNPSKSLGRIPMGSETRVLHRHGFKNWEDLYPNRQRVVTESLLKIIEAVGEDADVTEALRLAVVGTVEFAGHLSRWDRYYLKCNDAMAGHRFNFSTFVPEINVYGTDMVGRGTFSRRVSGLIRASEWSIDNLPTPSQGTGDLTGNGTHWQVACGDSRDLSDVADESIDLVLTDPPYHDDVHYGELSLPFRVWYDLPTSVLEGEASTNIATKVNVEARQYSEVLLGIFSECHRKLHDNGRMIFSYANHEPKAWVALFSALQRAGFSAVSCLSIHSENETDFKKRNVNSCNEDLMLELMPTRNASLGEVYGTVRSRTFMGEVARLFSQVGVLTDGWESEAIIALRDAKALESRERSLLAESAKE
jgi:DNA modification methylase